MASSVLQSDCDVEKPKIVARLGDASNFRGCGGNKVAQNQVLGIYFFNCRRWLEVNAL